MNTLRCPAREWGRGETGSERVVRECGTRENLTLHLRNFEHGLLGPSFKGPVRATFENLGVSRPHCRVLEVARTDHLKGIGRVFEVTFKRKSVKSYAKKSKEPLFDFSI